MSTKPMIIHTAGLIVITAIEIVFVAGYAALGFVTCTERQKSKKRDDAMRELMERSSECAVCLAESVPLARRRFFSRCEDPHSGTPMHWVCVDCSGACNQTCPVCRRQSSAMLSMGPNAARKDE